MRTRRCFLATAAALAAAPRPGFGLEPFPARPLKLVVPFAAGGSSDVLGRAVANALDKVLGQPVVVENRPGAGGHIGAAAVARAPADGYTLLFGTNGTLGIGPALYKSLPYSPGGDLAPIGMLQTLANVLIVNASLPVRDVRELIDYARAHPRTLTFASAGNGSGAHLAGELFNAAAGVETVHVPYKGGGAAMPDLLAGRVSMMFETIPAALQAIATGRVRGLAVTTPARSQAASDLPTLDELGLKGFDFTAWTGLFAPAGTPAPVIDRLNGATLAIARDADYLRSLRTMGTDPATSTPAALRAYMAADNRKWRQLIERANIEQQ